MSQHGHGIAGMHRVSAPPTPSCTPLTSPKAEQGGLSCDFCEGPARCTLSPIALKAVVCPCGCKWQLKPYKLCMMGCSRKPIAVQQMSGELVFFTVGRVCAECKKDYIVSLAYRFRQL